MLPRLKFWGLISIFYGTLTTKVLIVDGKWRKFSTWFWKIEALVKLFFNTKRIHKL